MLKMPPHQKEDNQVKCNKLEIAGFCFDLTFKHPEDHDIELFKSGGVPILTFKTGLLCSSRENRASRRVSKSIGDVSSALLWIRIGRFPPL